MPKPYSDDLRERVIEAVVAGASRREAADVWPTKTGIDRPLVIGTALFGIGLSVRLAPVQILG